jgi:hypothetical protein
MNPILGTISLDPTAEVLGTGMVQFKSAMGIDGLCCESHDGTELNLLAVFARQVGTGQFRRFIDQCKRNYSTVRVLEVWNDDLRKVLLRYGFTETKWTDVFGEKLDAMVWVPLHPSTPTCSQASPDPTSPQTECGP